MKKMRIFAVLLCAVMMAASLPSGMQAAGKMKLNTGKVTLKVSQTARLKVMNAKGTVKWNSGNKAVAKVSKNGLVRAVSKGSTVITATAKKKSVKAKITVVEASLPPNYGPVPEEGLTEEERALYGTILGFESIPKEGETEVKCFIQNPFQELLWFGREPQISVLREDGTFESMIREDLCWTCEMIGIPKGRKQSFGFPLKKPLEKGKTYRILKLFNSSRVYLDFVIGETDEEFTYISGILENFD